MRIKEVKIIQSNYYQDLWSFDLYVIVKRDRSNSQFFWSFHKRFRVLGYKLVGFISHMGTSTMVGHYVCHLLKEDRWVIFNDEKVRVISRWALSSILMGLSFLKTLLLFLHEFIIAGRFIRKSAERARIHLHVSTNRLM